MALHPLIASHAKVWYKHKLDTLYVQDPKTIESILLKPIANPYPHIQHQDHVIDDVRIRIYNREDAPRPSPVVVFVRASGYSMGSVDNSDASCSVLSQKLNCHVIAVEHSLGPTHRYPKPIDDVEKAVRWLRVNAQALGLCERRWVSWGESSGGNLMAALHHRLSLKKENPFLRSILFYPGVNCIDLFGSHLAYGQGYILDNNYFNFTRDHYIRDEKDKHLVEVSPALATSFSHLPPTDMCVGEYDLLKDEVIDYRNKVNRDGGQASVLIAPGMNHGFTKFFGKIPLVETIVDHFVGIICASFESCAPPLKAELVEVS